MRIVSPLPVILMALATLAGCAAAPQNKALLTYETVPDAAQLFEGTTPIGVSPVTRTYLADGKSNEIRTPDVRAVWPSGAETSFYTFITIGSDRVAKLERPANAPGLEVDVDHAKTVAATREREAERLKALQRSDYARASARCKDQQSGQGMAVSDDCK